MKTKIYIFALLCTIIFTAIGCGCSKEIKANQDVGLLKFYVPTSYKSRSDLRGSFYTDDTRKVFAIGDTNDYSSFIYIDVKKELNKPLSEYVKEANTTTLKDSEIKYQKIDNNKIEIYGREGYQTQQGDINIINYTYVTSIDNNIYSLTISGPDSKKEEIVELSKNIYSTIEKNSSN